MTSGSGFQNLFSEKNTSLGCASKCPGALLFVWLSYTHIVKWKSLSHVLTLCNPMDYTVEKAMAPHSSTLAWKIPWTDEPGRLQSMGSLGVGHDWATSLSLFTLMRWRRKWQPTPVFLPGETQGSNSGLLHSRWILYQLSPKGSPRILEWVAYPFSRGSSRPRNQTGVFCIAGRFFTSWAIREDNKFLAKKHKVIEAHQNDV